LDCTAPPEPALAERGGGAAIGGFSGAAPCSAPPGEDGASLAGEDDDDSSPAGAGGGGIDGEACGGTLVDVWYIQAQPEIEMHTTHPATIDRRIGIS
jgi:hypothetical protein